jgi:NitT/TauT family transport system substrate-binding protein
LDYLEDNCYCSICPKEKIETMRVYKQVYQLFVLNLFFVLALAACAQAGTPIAGPSEPAIPEPTTSEPVTLKIAVLPILDTLPMFVAQKEGLFAKHGVAVEFIPVGSAAERDQVIVAGQADGMINEAVSTALYNKEQVQVQTVRYAQAATPQQALFRILSAPRSNITIPNDLKGFEIGVSQGTVIEYLTDRLLQAEGFAPEEIKKIAVPKISDRMALLSSGELKAAMLPEPLSSFAAQQGAIVVLDDTKHPEYSYSTITFRKPVIDQNPEAVRAFLAAIEEATSLINANPDQYSSLLSDQKLVPQPLVGSFKVPTFVGAGVPSQAQWNDVLAWLKAKGLLTGDLAYADSINDSFLP